MRVNTVVSVLFSAFVTIVHAQDPGPSPTESIGCEPHEDHWHCDGPAPETSAAAVTSADSVVTPAVPSPTESVGCEPHDDHWHCDGPKTGAAPAPTDAADDHAHEHEDEHEHEAEHEEHVNDHETEAAGGAPAEPSPTESVGCEPHGDHWHCDGPASTAAVTSAPSSASAAPSLPSNNASTPSPTGSGAPTSSVLPFEGAAATSQVMHFVLLAGLLGVTGLLVVI
ncbi:MAG: hypothetical protein M1837_005268 [Sclerophora amabilis]|nr:MAG: hypothetical protein M1837_005268 [Sclerophora amabilis]